MVISPSFGIRYDTGYRFNLGQGFFVDPQGTIAWVNTDMDNFTLFNTPVNFSNGDSVRGSLGGRVGYSWLWGASVVEPFFDGKVWQEFEGDNKAALTSAGHKLAFKDQVDQTWGELGGGVNVFTGANSSVFVKADALVGGSLDGFNVRGGGRIAW
ncbi:MAG: autotransporter outer membrane beta-barrel domain-containing protein [Methyloceanibacter sp.]